MLAALALDSGLREEHAMYEATGSFFLTGICAGFCRNSIDVLS